MAEYKAKDVIRLLKEKGYSEVSIRGDHHKFSKAGGHPVIVPYTSLNSSIAIGTYKAILRQIKDE
ncbi:type II toxin-antitoxin system HicA family toxin [Ligilactobacillus equi]|uniref:type II toxin-antitoxin system HicA family toxin n=1 Tax=Ligilactobacillus equi TaxID=137357 RepID=UPI002ED59E3B